MLEGLIFTLSSRGKDGGENWARSEGHDTLIWAKILPLSRLTGGERWNRRDTVGLADGKRAVRVGLRPVYAVLKRNSTKKRSGGKETYVHPKIRGVIGI